MTKLLPILLLTGCCYVRTPDATVIDIGTGRRCVHVGKVVVTHSEIDDTLRATGALVGEAAKAAGYGNPGEASRLKRIYPPQ
jgi:hypothetical protein